MLAEEKWHKSARSAGGTYKECLLPATIGRRCFYRTDDLCPMTYHTRRQLRTTAHSLDDMVQHHTHLCEGIKPLTQTILRELNTAGKYLSVCLKKQEGPRKDARTRSTTVRLRVLFPKAIVASNDATMQQYELQIRRMKTRRKKRGQRMGQYRDDQCPRSTYESKHGSMIMYWPWQTVHDRKGLGSVDQGLTTITTKKVRKTLNEIVMMTYGLQPTKQCSHSDGQGLAKNKKMTKKTTMLRCPGRWPWYGQGDRCPETRDDNIITTRHTDEAWLLRNQEEMPNGSQDTFIDQLRRCQWQPRYWSREEDQKDSRGPTATMIEQHLGTVR